MKKFCPPPSSFEQGKFPLRWIPCWVVAVKAFYRKLETPVSFTAFCICPYWRDQVPSSAMVDHCYFQIGSCICELTVLLKGTSPVIRWLLSLLSARTLSFFFFFFDISIPNIDMALPVTNSNWKMTFKKINLILFSPRFKKRHSILSSSLFLSLYRL